MILFIFIYLLSFFLIGRNIMGDKDIFFHLRVQEERQITSPMLFRYSN